MVINPSDMTVDEVAQLLRISSRATIDAWLCGGHFPGAYKADGEWRFPRSHVDDVVIRIAEMRTRNENADITVLDMDDDDPLPLV